METITLYTKSWCPFCARAKALLGEHDLSFDEIDIEKNPEKRAEMIDRAGGRTTVPQVFIGERHVGGSDDLMTFASKGGLDRLSAG